MMMTKRVISFWMEVGFATTFEVAAAMPPLQNCVSDVSRMNDEG